jgi:hypothetical protein
LFDFSIYLSSRIGAGVWEAVVLSAIRRPVIKEEDLLGDARH